MFIKPALDLIAIVGEAARAKKSGDFQVSYSSPMNFGGYMVQFVSPQSLQCGTPVYLDRDGEVARLRAEVDGHRKDAERYRWLRNDAMTGTKQDPAVLKDGPTDCCEFMFGDELDAAIDAAMGASA